VSRFLFALPSVKSPVGRQFVDLAVRLEQLGHNVLIATHTDPADTQLSLGLGRHVTVTAWPDTDGTTLRDARYLFGLLRSWRPDSVAAQFSFVNWALVLARICGVPRRIAWYHTLVEQSAADSDERRAVWNLRLRRRRLVYGCATEIVSVSRVGVDDLVRIFRVPRTKCVIVPNGIVDEGARTSSTAARRVVGAGRMVPSKNQMLLVEAFTRLRTLVPGAELVLIGEGPLMPVLRARVHELGLSSAVRFTGKIPHSEAMAELRAADVLAHPSRIDNCPVVVQEAMGLGIPVVATDVGGIREVIDDGRTGLLVPPADVEQLTRALRRVLCDDDVRRDMGAAARRTFEERFERSRFVDRAAEFMLAATTAATRSP